jgi:hypothetical protein
VANLLTIVSNVFAILGVVSCLSVFIWLCIPMRCDEPPPPVDSQDAKWREITGDDDAA